ncbi:MAG: hypothetical protein AB1295_06055 [Candidatus Micrarchaeota archaeon]
MKTKEQSVQKKGVVDTKEPKPGRSFSRRDALRAGLAMLGGAALSRCGSEYKAKPNDGGTSDASGLDANVSLDASMMDSGVDAALPDARLPDAMADSAAPACSMATSEEKLGWVLALGNPGVIGTAYEVTYTRYVDDTHVEVDVKCALSGTPVVTAHQLTLDQESTIPLGNMDLRMTLTLFNEINARFDAVVQ